MPYQTVERQTGVCRALRRRAAVQLGVVSVPLVERGIDQVVVLQQHVVIGQTAVAVHDEVVKLIGGDVGRVVEVMQSDGQHLRVAHHRDVRNGPVGGLRLHQLGARHAVPQRVQRRYVADVGGSLSDRTAEHATCLAVQCHRQLLVVVASLQLTAAILGALGGQCRFIALLVGQCYEAILAVGQVEYLHGVGVLSVEHTCH